MEGKELLDFVGSNGIYSLLFNMVLRNKKVLVNYINPKSNPSEIEQHMIYDSLVVADLPDGITKNIVDALEGKKNVIVGSLCKDEEFTSISRLSK